MKRDSDLVGEGQKREELGTKHAVIDLDPVEAVTG